MSRYLTIAFVTLVLLASSSVFSEEQSPAADKAMEQDVTQGALRVKQDDGTVVECPLKHTDVKATISGFVARVVVTQIFENPFDEKIEAVYVFPLPHSSAVDDMTMVIGDRRIVGLIKRRAEARQIYEQALMQGQTAALLEQERPNIFTQSVGDIVPGQEVRIEISYVDILEYDMGTYEFHFPMVVGPRYNAGAAFPGTTGGTKPEPTTIAGTGPTTKPHGVNPSYLKPEFRNGHDISLLVSLFAGVPIWNIQVPSHEAEIDQNHHRGAAVKLSPKDSIPNKDFVMKYTVVGQKPEMAVLFNRKANEDGYFMLMIQPRLDDEIQKAPPREMVFLIDVSGSMSGEPTEKVKEAMRRFFEQTKPEDKLQVITFAGGAERLFPQPVPVTDQNVATALNFTNATKAGGGTEMLRGIQMVLNEPVDPERVRICIMLTDGYIGNEAEIIAEVGKRAGDKIRFWTIGIGSSPNRFLLDGVAKQGGGMSKVLGLKDDPTELVGEIVERIHRAQLADIAINWQDLGVYETYPVKIPELWAGRPVILFGRYSGAGKQTIEITGRVEDQPINYPLEVTFPAVESENEVLSKVWARRKIEQLMAETYYGDAPEVVEEITEIALNYRLMSQFTSFVAVDESEMQTLGEPVKPPRRVDIPVPLPQGVQFEGIFGPQSGEELGRVDLCFDAVSEGVPTSVQGLAAPTATAVRGVEMKLGRAIRFYEAPARHPGLPAARAPQEQAMRQITALGYIAGGVAVDRRSAGQGLKRYRAGEPIHAGDFFMGYGVTSSGADAKESGSYREEAEQVLKDAQLLQKEGKLLPARAQYQLAYLLDLASGNMAGVAPQAAQALEGLDEAWGREQTKQLPALGSKLDLVIRNRSLSEALKEVAKAAKIEIEISDRAEADACDLLGVTSLRVNYLDLRGAKVATALDWLVSPFHLTWQVEKGKKVVVTSTRQLPGQWPWVFDVSVLALPDQKELGDDPAKASEKAKSAAKEFLDVMRIALSLPKDATAAVWLSPGQLLVYGDWDLHNRTDAVIEFLRDDYGPGVCTQDLVTFSLKPVKALQSVTSKRYAARKEAIEKQRAARERNALSAALNDFSWRLLAEATKGKLDLEALTDLQIAWSNPRLIELLQGDSQLSVHRSQWALSEAAGLLPGENELNQLAKGALLKTAQASESLLSQLKENPESAPVFLSVLYSTLAQQKGAASGWSDKAEADKRVGQTYALLLTGRKSEQLADLRLLASLLLKAPAPATARALEERLGENIAGADSIVLAAVAAQRCGGPTWNAFREQAREILSRQPLEGSVVVLVHNLCGGKPAISLAKAQSR